jgi:hypothetical protein
VLISIIRKRLHLEASLCTILQTLSVTVCEKIVLDQMLTFMPPQTIPPPPDTKLNPFAD